jgi:hypothetical protein
MTVTCDCEAVRLLAYGERWTCEGCGRQWDTNKIPAAEYWGIMREMRRYRLVAIGAALGLGVTFALLAFLVSQRLLLLMPIVMAGWFLLYMPGWRRRVRRRARSLPAWQLDPE